jgi:hypothetical protein
MKYYLNGEKISQKDFPSSQLMFLKQNKIKWILLEKNAVIAPVIRKIVVDSLIDNLSNEKYYKIRLN